MQKKLPQELCRSGRDYQRKLQGTAVFAAETDRLTSFERFENEDAIYKGQLTQRNYDNDPPTGIQGSIRSVVPSDDDATSPEAVGSEEEKRRRFRYLTEIGFAMKTYSEWLGEDSAISSTYDTLPWQFCIREYNPDTYMNLFYKANSEGTFFEVEKECKTIITEGSINGSAPLDAKFKGYCRDIPAPKSIS